MIVYELPLPPSTNNLFSSNNGKRYVGGKYKEWRKQADALVMSQGKLRTIEGPVAICIVIRDGAGGDLDNRCKAVLDYLVHHKIIEDDNGKIVRSIYLTFGQVDGARVEICRPEVKPDWIQRRGAGRAA